MAEPGEPSTDFFDYLAIDGVEVNGTMFSSISFHVEAMKAMNGYPMRPDDVVLSSYQRSGTHWAIAMVNLVMKDGDIEAVRDTHIHDRAIWMEYAREAFKGTLDVFAGEKGPNPMVEAEKQPSPRLFTTHMGYDMMPADVQTGKCKAIVVVRNPKSVLNSHHHLTYNNPMVTKAIPFDLLLDCQLTDSQLKYQYGTWFNHIAGWLDHKHQLKDSLLFVYYEDMVKDMAGVLRQVTQFLQRDITEDTIQKMAHHLSYKQMKDNPQTGEAFKEAFKPIEKLNNEETVLDVTHMRKGEIADWKNKFTVAQSERVDEYFKPKFEKYGLAFQYD